jgi:hypothetical protein
MMKRECGDCQLCCRLLPVKGIGKPANTRCQHQRAFKGCAVYHKPGEGFPWECGLWNCYWLIGDDIEGLRRPDRSHYVIDVMPDYVTNTFSDGTERKIACLQIWIDPKHPDAHKDPGLRAWFLREAPGYCGLIRNGNESAFLLIPPNLSDTGDWFEVHSAIKDREHTFAETLAVIAGAR